MSDEIRYHDLGYGITCIDTQLYRSGLAACYLIEHDGMVGFVDTGTNNSVSILQEVLRRKGIANEKVNYIENCTNGNCKTFFQHSSYNIHPSY